MIWEKKVNPQHCCAAVIFLPLSIKIAFGRAQLKNDYCYLKPLSTIVIDGLIFQCSGDQL